MTTRDARIDPPAPPSGGIAARAQAAAAPRYLDGLNAEQREAVETTDGRFWFWPAREPARPVC